MDTKFAKPSVSAEVQPVGAKPCEMLYCIEHGQMIKAELATGGLGHVQIDGDTLDFCYFPKNYAFCPPPAYNDGDWAAQDLSEDEKAQAELCEIGEWLGDS